jgi:alkylhydroperoxidase/carboxymuconolactone decarboxylase family protein YurZ
MFQPTAPSRRPPSCWANPSTCHPETGNRPSAMTFVASQPSTRSATPGPDPGLDTRAKALISVTIAATLGTRDPLRGQLRIALNNGVTTDEIIELFIHLEAYAGAARAFDSYQVALEVFAEDRHL